MGGTSAKAGCIVDHVPLVVPEIEVGGRVHMGRTVKGSGYPIRTPCIDLAEVSAGGGTIIWADATGTLNVGPLSAGADPGPACYKAGGNDATITDANLILGRIGTELLGGKLHVARDAAASALQRVADKTRMNPSEVAAASVKLVNLHMAKAVHIVSLERGLDPRGFTLVSFGGAGPMHAAELAEEVGIGRVIVPPWPGLFSALSMLLSDAKYTYVKGMLASLEDLADERIEQSFLSMTNDALKHLEERELDVSNASIIRSLDLRYTGQGYEIEIAAPEPFKGNEVVRRFVEKHESTYGYRQSGEKLEVTALRLTVILPIVKAKLSNLHRSTVEGRRPPHRQVWFEGKWFDTPVFQREGLLKDDVVKGPAIVEEYDSTVVVPPRWMCEAGNAGCLILRKTED
jgi:N-methylhydantoinase A